MAIIDNPVTVVNGGSTPVGPPDPEQVYRDTRPSNWMVMPTPSANEAYFLLYVDGTSGTQVKVDLQANLDDVGTVYIDFGTTDSDGIFTPIPALSTSGIDGSTITQYVPISNWVDIGTNGDDGYQLIAKLYPENGRAIDTISLGGHSYKSNKFIVELAMNAPSASTVAFGDSGTGTGLSSLVYANLLGTYTGISLNAAFRNCQALKSVMGLDGAATDCTAAFYGCYSLLAIPEFDTSGCQLFGSMFQACYSLSYVPQLDYSSGTTFASAFNACYSITSVPDMDLSSATNFSSMFANCYALEEVGDLDTSSGNNFSSMFATCYSLKKTPTLVLDSATNLNNMFQYCYTLTEVTIDTRNIALGSATASSIFSRCFSLKTFKDAHFSFAGLKGSMQRAFEYCYNLTSLDGLDFQHSAAITSFAYMFDSCKSLSYANIPFNKASSENNSRLSNMFYNIPASYIVDFSNASFMTNTISTTGVIISQAASTTENIHVFFGGSTFVRLSASATSLFNGSHIHVYVNDSLYSSYSNDTNWRSLGTRLHKMSDYPVNS